MPADEFQATLKGGPELAAALSRLDDAVRVKASKEALHAAGGVLAQEWQARVPVLDANYQHSLEGAQRAAKTKAGASGSVAPRKVPGLPDGAQPSPYAARLEFGMLTGPPNHRPDPPSTPPASARSKRPATCSRGPSNDVAVLAASAARVPVIRG